MQAIGLTFVDWLIIAIYFGFVLGIGFYLRRYTKTEEDFFLAGRKNSAWVAGLVGLAHLLRRDHCCQPVHEEEAGGGAGRPGQRPDARGRRSAGPSTQEAWILGHSLARDPRSAQHLVLVRQGGRIMNELNEPKKMKPIWYFVGLVLLSMGAVVLLTEICRLATGVQHATVLARLHPDVWWGAVMVASGAVFFFKNR